MLNPYIAVLEINSDGIIEIINGKIDTISIYKYHGFEFKMMYCDEEFFQISVYAYNTYTTHLLGASIDNYGSKVGGKYDNPVLITTEGGFAGVLCSYIFMISKKSISTEDLYRSLGSDGNWNISSDNYRKLQERLRYSERIVGFTELMHFIEMDKDIYCKTEKMVEHTSVYNEDFHSKYAPKRKGSVTFQENLTLLAAKDAVMAGKRTAVLNFANPVEPGGGVLRGAKAQEENICRSGNLYKALISENAAPYYKTISSIMTKNQFNSMFIGLDLVLYSPNVIILKENVNYNPMSKDYCNEEYSQQNFSVDVLTCAAPFFSGSGYIVPNGDLQHIFARRIRNILEVAIENDIEVIILGAFGCGAFHNPPDVVADAFKEVLLELRYRKAFEQVVFAVKRTDLICPNIEAFKKRFSLFPDVSSKVQ